MSIKQTYFVAPSAWASFLVNGDQSGLDTAEAMVAARWLESLDAGNCVGCDDFGFTRYHDALAVMPLAADCQRYLFLKEECVV